jgi:hypothetical protein
MAVVVLTRSPGNEPVELPQSLAAPEHESPAFLQQLRNGAWSSRAFIRHAKSQVARMAEQPGFHTTDVHAA